MPELPEIEIIKRSLFKKINKAKIVKVKIYNKNLRYKIPKTFSKKLINEKILKISRRSKYLIFHFKNKKEINYFWTISSITGALFTFSIVTVNS